MREDDEGAGGARGRGVEAPARERVVGGEDALGRVRHDDPVELEALRQLERDEHDALRGKRRRVVRERGRVAEQLLQALRLVLPGGDDGGKALVIVRCGHGFAQRGSIGRLVGAGNDGRRLVSPLDG